MKKSKTYSFVSKFLKKYPGTIAFRVKKHCEIIDKHLNPGEEILYAFVAQKNYHSLDFVNTNVIALTNKRILIGTKRVLWGYFLTTITPDMFNDLSVRMGMIWGRIVIDTVKEEVILSNISSKALAEIETNITDYMMEEKKKYVINSEK